MPRRVEQLLDQFDELRAEPRLRRESDLAEAFFQFGSVMQVVDLLGQHRDTIQRQAECLADISHRRPRPIADDRRCHRGSLAAVLVVEILDDLFAPAVLEVHVDVGSLATLLADEPLEQHVDPVGVHRRHAEAEADD